MMKFKTGRQLGLGNRNYTLTEEFNFFGRVLPEGLTVDGSSVPKVPILFLGAFILIFFDLNNGPISFPKTLPRFEAFLNPIILKIQNNEIMLINSKKYLTIFI